MKQNCISFSFVIIFFNKNNIFIYKYAYTRIGTIKMVLHDDSKPSIIYKINDNLFFLPLMMSIVKFFSHIIHLIKWIL